MHFFGEKDGREWLLRSLPKHAVCAEIGVYWGRFSELILRIARPRKLHLIDPWKYEADPVYDRSLYGGSLGQNQARMDAIYESVVKCFKSKRVEIHRAGSVACSSQFPDNYFDWIYIDGNHQYEFVKQDLEVYFPKVKSGGFVAGDDYGRDPNNWTRDGVTRAVDEAINNGLYEKIVIDKNQFLLKKH
ncbi:MAG TPA: class I SAM-dependent methyltransferase [Candidatus Deferrimicrobiaceae bacterium]|nr:class I SAM-dependent methyltransferase [Candidatus Deferrimicrobiaceae bacterium]